MSETPDAGSRPSSTIRIEKTIRNAPVEEEDLDVMTEQGKKPGRPKKGSQPEEEDSPDENFAQHLQDHTVKIHVDRVSPREFKGKNIGGLIEEYVPPITIEEVETDVRNRFGGGRYRVRVIKNGRFIGARGLNIYGDPKVALDEFDQDFGEDFEKFDPRAAEPYAGPPVIDDETVELRKKIEKAKLRNALNEVEGRASGPAVNPAIDPDRIRRDAEERVRKEMEMRREMDSFKTDIGGTMKDFMNSMERLLKSQKETDPGRDHDIVNLDNKIERIKTELMGEVKSNLGRIETMIQSMNQRPPEKPDTMPQILTAMIEGFSRMSQSGDSKLHAIAQAESAKTQAVMDSMKAISDAQMKVAQAQTDRMVTVLQAQSPTGINEIAKTVGAFRDMAENMGWSTGGGGGGGEEGPGEPQDIGTKLMGMLEKVLPSILAANAAKTKGVMQQGQGGGGPQMPPPIPGQNVIPPQLEAVIAQHAQQAAQRLAIPMAEQMANKRFAELMAQKGIAQAGTPPPPQQVPPPPPVQQVVAPPVAPPPIPVPKGPEQVPVVVVDQPVQESPAINVTESEIEQDKRDIVNSCMEVLMKEIHIRPRKPEWPEVAYDELPEDVVDKLALVTDAEGLLDAIAPYAKPEYIESIKNILASDQRCVNWLVNGLNEFKDMYTEEVNEGADATPA